MCQRINPRKLISRVPVASGALCWRIYEQHSLKLVLTRPCSFILHRAFSWYCLLVSSHTSDLIRQIPLKCSTYVWHRLRFTTAVRDLACTYLTISSIYDKRYLNTGLSFRFCNDLSMFSILIDLCIRGDCIIFRRLYYERKNFSSRDFLPTRGVWQRVNSRNSAKL